MRQQLESFLGWVGLFVLGGSYFGSAVGVFRDPYYMFWAACGGFLLSAWFCYSAWTDVTDPSETSPIQAEDGTRLYSKPAYRRSLRARRISCIPVAISLAVVGFFVCAERDGAFDLVYASKPIFFESMNARYVPLSDDDLPLHPPPPTYYVLNTDEDHDDHGSSIYHGDTVRFVIAKRPRVPWLEIEAINVDIEDFDPDVPGVETYSHTSHSEHELFQRPAHFIAEIDSPSSSKDSFQAQFADFETNDRNEFGFLILDDDRPLPIVVTIQGKSPGIYSYSVSVTVRNLWRTQTIKVCSGRKCMYRPIPESQGHETNPNAEPESQAPHRVPAPPPNPGSTFKNV